MYQFKNGMESHGYQITEQEEVLDRDISQVFVGEPALSGTQLHYFGEMDKEWNNDWFPRSPAESMNWSGIYAFHRGLSRRQVRDDALLVQEMHFAYGFFDKHAPCIDATISPFAFCVLREGLHASDVSMLGRDKLSHVKSILQD